VYIPYCRVARCKKWARVGSIAIAFWKSSQRKLEATQPQPNVTCQTRNQHELRECFDIRRTHAQSIPQRHSPCKMPLIQRKQRAVSPISFFEKLRMRETDILRSRRKKKKKRTLPMSLLNQRPSGDVYQPHQKKMRTMATLEHIRTVAKTRW
jgi:hypothetical protein